ncbi:MAG: sensor histidine kinase [Thermomicrobiaceae bacterium]|nr:sensor histidine kinase [Thermomicrobiaceae bacterium]
MAQSAAPSPRLETGAGAAGRVRPLPGAATFPFELQARLLHAQTLPELFEIAASMAARVPGTVGVWLYQRDERGTLVLVHHWRASQAALTALSGEALGSLIHQRWIAAHRLGYSAADFARPFTPPGFPTGLVVPMLIGEEFVGALAAERRDGVVFPYAPEDIVTLATVAATTAQSMQTIVLRQRLADRESPEQQQEALDAERRRIGRELHDGIVQDLAYLRLKLEMLERTVSREPARAEAEVRQMREQVDRSIVTLRETIAALRRPKPAARGITGELRDLAARLGEQHPELVLDVSEMSGVRLAPEVERAVVGIVREALQNIRKHAQASSVRVEVQQEDDEIHVIVADDGVGMESAAAAQTDGLPHFGLEQMQELAVDMGGSLEIDSAKGRGTRVHARIPLDLAQSGE